MDNTLFGARSLFALACFTFAGLAHGGIDCGTAKVHADQRKCLERAASVTQAELETARALLIKRIQTWDEDPDYSQRSVELLKQSFERFGEFRDTECEYEAAAAAGGNGAGDMRLQCQIDLNRHYAESIRKQLSWYSASR